MKTALIAAIFIIALAHHGLAKPGYILLKPRWYGGWKLMHVDKPEVAEHWFYDNDNDTYYRIKNCFGMGLKLKPNDVPGPTHTSDNYILIERKWLSGWHLIHVDKPGKKLNKWYYDDKSHIYYRMKNLFGIGIRLT